MAKTNNKQTSDSGNITINSNVPKTYKRSKQSAMEFITYLANNWAKSAVSGDTSYRAWIEEKDGKKYINFASGSYINAEDVTKNYIFEVGQGQGVSPVISFSPTYNIGVDGADDALVIETSVLDTFTNQMYNFVYGKDGVSTKFTKEQAEQTADKEVIYFSGSGYTNRELERMASNLWLKQSKLTVQATLELFGDPNLKPGMNIAVIAIMPSGVPHVSSGIYLVDEVTHEISKGTFKTTLTIYRNEIDVSIGDDGKIKFTVGAANAPASDDDDSSSSSDDSSSNGTSSSSSGKSNTEDWDLPLNAPITVTSEMGQRWGAFHNGIDLVNSDHIIKCVGDGTVTISEYHNSYGNHVFVDHGNGISTGYAHMASTPMVKGGDKVSKGQQLGVMGTTGDSTGVHLHFNVFRNGPWAPNSDFINPREYFNF